MELYEVFISVLFGVEGVAAHRTFKLSFVFSPIRHAQYTFPAGISVCVCVHPLASISTLGATT